MKQQTIEPTKGITFDHPAIKIAQWLMTAAVIPAWVWASDASRDIAVLQHEVASLKEQLEAGDGRATVAIAPIAKTVEEHGLAIERVKSGITYISEKIDEAVRVCTSGRRR